MGFEWTQKDYHCPTCDRQREASISELVGLVEEWVKARRNYNYNKSAIRICLAIDDAENALLAFDLSKIKGEK